MSTLNVTNISDGTNTTATTNVVKGSAKAWVNFNGTGTVAIREAYNVGSITDNGTGNYTVNFTTAMPDTNYSFHCQARATASNFVWGVPQIGSTKTTSQFQFVVIQSTAGTLTDSSELNVAIFR